ncbi:TPA: type 4b pilus protein PilO2 [Pseudomonas aeruginosa]|nr:type 4b pilus protein PilO2 [Pseudomonas aeruginosa]HDQ4723250.1 type 4b pilus protein PilO2 [Pseudomonas aeruginosa]
MEKANARAIVRGRVGFLAGLHWEPQGVVHRRRLNRVARSKGADALVDYAYLDEKGKAHRVVGLARLKRLGLPSGTRAVYALGLLIADQLGSGGYAIVPLDGEVYALVGSIGGKLYRDVVGDRGSVEQARQTFLSFNAEPEGGWQAFAPQEWGLENSQPFDLDGLLNARRFPAAARLRSASLRGPLVASVGVVAVLCAGYLGYAYHQGQQLKAQQEAQRLALLAQQAANRRRTRLSRRGPSRRGSRRLWRHARRLGGMSRCPWRDGSSARRNAFLMRGCDSPTGSRSEARLPILPSGSPRFTRGAARRSSTCRRTARRVGSACRSSCRPVAMSASCRARMSSCGG